MTHEGTADRAIRVVLGIVLIALAWFALGFGTLFGISCLLFWVSWAFCVPCWLDVASSLRLGHLSAL